MIYIYINYNLKHKIVKIMLFNFVGIQNIKQDLEQQESEDGISFSPSKIVYF